MQTLIEEPKILKNGCILELHHDGPVEEREDGDSIRVLIWNPDRTMSTTGYYTEAYVKSDQFMPHIMEQARGILAHKHDASISIEDGKRYKNGRCLDGI